MYTLYILQSEIDGSYYVGQTDNLERRIAEHNRGKNKYTKTKKPWKIIYTETFNSRAEAIKRESEIKRKKRQSYIKWLINQAGYEIP